MKFVNGRLIINCPFFLSILLERTAFYKFDLFYFRV